MQNNIIFTAQVKWAVVASCCAALAEAPLDHAKRSMLGSIIIASIVIIAGIVISSIIVTSVVTISINVLSVIA